jgi:hypothetical protein
MSSPDVVSDLPRTACCAPCALDANRGAVSMVARTVASFRERMSAHAGLSSPKPQSSTDGLPENIGRNYPSLVSGDTRLSTGLQNWSSRTYSFAIGV